jgi:hypothetical protein
LNVLGNSNLTHEELLTLLCAAKAARDRDWLMILIAFWHGLRASEVIALTATCVVDAHISVRRLKGSMHTVQPLMGLSNPYSMREPPVCAQLD